MKTAFISYCHKDACAAADIEKRLTDAGINVWRDPEIDPGKRIPEEVMAKIDEHDHVLALLSNNSIQSPSVMMEIGVGLAKGDGVVVAVLLDDLARRHIPPFLWGQRDVRHVPYGEDKEEGMRELIELLRPGSERLRMALDPFGQGPLVVLTGTSAASPQEGPLWSAVPAGSIAALFAFYTAFKIVFDPQRIKKALWNYANFMPVEQLSEGDNVFTIAGPKVNRFAAGFLAQCQRPDLDSLWFVYRREWQEYGRFCALVGHTQTYRPTFNRPKGHGTGYDYGLVVWAPGLMTDRGTRVGAALITGGCHTGATRVAAERAANAQFYEELTAKGFGGDPEEMRSRFDSGAAGLWAIFSVHCEDSVPELESVRICEAGTLTTTDSVSSGAFQPGYGIPWAAP